MNKSTSITNSSSSSSPHERPAIPFPLNSDLVWTEDDDDASFKSAKSSSSINDISESFMSYACESTVYHHLNLSNAHDEDLEVISSASESSSNSGEFVDAISFEKNEDFHHVHVDVSNEGKEKDHESQVEISEKEGANDSIENTKRKDHEKSLGKQKVDQGTTRTGKLMTQNSIDISHVDSGKMNLDEKTNSSLSISANSTKTHPTNNAGTNKSNYLYDQQHSHAKINSFTFNQDKNCIAIATSTGYRIRTLPPSFLQSKQHENDQYSSKVKIHQVSLPNNKSNQNGNGALLIQILYSTSVLAIVKTETPRILSIVHAKTAKPIVELPFTSAIRRIEMNIETLVVLTADGILHVFGFSTKKTQRNNRGIYFIQAIPILHASESTRMITADGASTSGAFFDLSSHLFASDGESNIGNMNNVGLKDFSWVITKNNEGIGFVSVYKILHSSSSSLSSLSANKSGPSMSLKLVKSFQAHDNGISRVAIGGAANSSLKQKLFATASLRGTKIRVFSLPDCTRLYEFHRGTSPCNTLSLSFNFDASRIAVSTSKGTVHVFNISNAEKLSEMDIKNNLQRKPTRQKFFDKILSSRRNSNDECTIIRSVAKIKCKKPAKAVTITLLDTNKKNEGNEDLVAICYDNGKLLVYAVRKNASNNRPRPRPVFADDIMFDSESALVN